IRALIVTGVRRVLFRSLVLERMRATLARLAPHPAHTRRLGGAQPEDIRRLEDWRRLPLLTKAELRDAYPFGLACGREQGYRRVRSEERRVGKEWGARWE